MRRPVVFVFLLAAVAVSTVRACLCTGHKESDHLTYTGRFLHRLFCQSEYQNLPAQRNQQIVFPPPQNFPEQPVYIHVPHPGLYNGPYPQSFPPQHPYFVPMFPPQQPLPPPFMPQYIPRPPPIPPYGHHKQPIPVNPQSRPPFYRPSYTTSTQAPSNLEDDIYCDRAAIFEDLASFCSNRTSANTLLGVSDMKYIVRIPLPRYKDPSIKVETRYRVVMITASTKTGFTHQELLVAPTFVKSSDYKWRLSNESLFIEFQIKDNGASLYSVAVVM